MQADVRLGVGGGFAVEDLVVHRNSKNDELSDGFSRFLDGSQGQRACECSGDYDRKRASISPRQEITGEKKKLTESEEGEEENEALHVGRVEIEGREKKVMSSKAAAKRGETRLVGDPILRKSPV